ncbi:MAG: transcription elongation GreA/GreB family factor [Gammaproteobacteria bacterium]|jgi:transcription elongation GreA/GreB family factor
MDKTRLHQTIITALEVVLDTSKKAAMQAHEAATNGETVAENKYDTFGLEASYLAAGQSKRVSECEESIKIFKLLEAQDFNPESMIRPGALVTLEDAQNNIKYLFLSPVSGGLKVSFNQLEVTLVTPSAPLGKALMSQVLGDDITVLMGNEKQSYIILNID